MINKVSDKFAYNKVCAAFKRDRSGLTIADITARTALPLETVRELAPRAATEYSARLDVTESGEIRYVFPAVWTSRYTGFKARLGRFWDKTTRFLKTAGKVFFKIWIMVMLIGYFVLFMLIALAALLLSMAASASNNNNDRRSNSGGGFFLAQGIFDFIFRIWFYSALTQSMDNDFGRGIRPAKPKGKPLYKAIFSFVFGDGDPNADIESREKQSVIAYIQANNGVLSLPEFIMLTGRDVIEAERAITEYCVEFGGSPEATDDGTVVYRFDAIMLRADKKDRSFGEFSGILKNTKAFSSNKKNMNVVFCLINSVNLFFGSYFFINAINSGAIQTQEHFNNASYLYGITYRLFNQMLGIANPLPVLLYGLGCVPIAFSIFFWLVPALRAAMQKKDNEKIKFENFRKIGASYIWRKPLAVKSADLQPGIELCTPSNLPRAQDTIIKELGAYSMPDVSLNESGETIYSYKELEREKGALQKYRQSIDTSAQDLGEIVFRA